MTTSTKVREDLPAVQVKCGKEIVTGKVTGRKDRFATVYVDNSAWEFAWSTIARAIATGRPLRV